MYLIQVALSMVGVVSVNHTTSMMSYLTLRGCSKLVRNKVLVLDFKACGSQNVNTVQTYVYIMPP